MRFPLANRPAAGASLACLAGIASLPAAEPLPLSREYWSDPTFLKSFNGSYRIEARIEPAVSGAERELLVGLQKLMEAGRREAALAELEGSPLTTGSAALQFNRGNLHFEEGDSEAAVEAYGTAIELYPSFRRAHRNLAIALVHSGDLEEALEHLVEAIRLGDADGATFGLLGYCRLQREEWESALQAYRMAGLTQPDTADWKAGVAQCLQHLDARAEAVALLDEVIEGRPEEPAYASLQASIFLELEQPEDAVKALELPRRLGRLDGGGLLLLADLHLRADRPEDARGCIDEAFAGQREPALDQVLPAIASATRAGEWRLAALLVGYAMPEEGRAPRALRLAAARLKIESGDAPDDGAAELRQLLNEDPSDGEVLLALARYERARGNAGEAELIFERATAVSGTAADAWVDLARLRVDQRRYGVALEAIDRALELRPGGDLQSYRAALANLVDAGR